MEIYKDMLEKLKYHKQILMNAFIRKNYYPSNDEVEAALQSINSRLSLFETYISKPGSTINTTELNYCFDMIYKDIEIMYKVLEEILIKEYSSMKLFIESTLLELEAKADRFIKKNKQEANSAVFGTTILFESNSWNLTTQDQQTVINLGNYDLVQGIEIACFANINNVEDPKISFRFTAEDHSKSFTAFPYNICDNVTYTVPGTLAINKIEKNIKSSAIVNSYIKFKEKLDPVNTYKMVGGKKLMSVTSKKTGITRLVEYPDLNNNNYYVTEDCTIEFYVVDGNVNDSNFMEYSLNMAPLDQNFSLQNGTILIDKDIKRIHIEAQAGLSVGFSLEHGLIYAECLDAIIVDAEHIIYNGNLDIRDIMLREYVKTNTTNYNIQVCINSVESIVDHIESIYVKEI